MCRKQLHCPETFPLTGGLPEASPSHCIHGQTGGTIVAIYLSRRATKLQNNNYSKTERASGALSRQELHNPSASVRMAEIPTSRYSRGVLTNRLFSNLVLKNVPCLYLIVQSGYGEK